jgi:hypothetical protein
MSWWIDDLDPEEVMNYVTEFFDYDHHEGKLRWTKDATMWRKLPSSMKRGAQQGAVAGSCRKGYDYEIKMGGRPHRALPMIWEHQTYNCRRKIMTIKPNEDLFRIDNLCVAPTRNKRGSPLRRAPKARAKGLNVVSWSYERGQFTVVQVDDSYKKTILSYHKDIDSALDALREPTVSFL